MRDIQHQIMKLFKRMIGPVNARISMLISRAVVTVLSDSEGIQKLKASILADETAENIERFHDYGFSSHAPDNSEAVIVFPLGNREHGIAIKVDNREFRIKNLAKGEVALFTDEGDSIIMKRGNKIEINALSQVDINTQNANINASGNATISAANATIDSPNLNATGNMDLTGNLTVGGNATITGNAIAAILQGASVVAASSMTVGGTELSGYSSHTHDYTDDGAPKTTEPPN